MITKIQGFRVLLGTVPENPSNSDIGLYAIPVTISGVTTYTNELRWVEQPLTVPGSPAWSPTAWKAGIITGIGEIEASSDFKNGGNSGDYAGLDVTTSAGATVLAQLAAAGITLAGQACEVWEFIGNETDSGVTSVNVIFTGVIAVPKRNDVGYKIPVKAASYLLTAPTGTVINNGQYESVAALDDAISNESLTANYPYANDDDDGKMVPLTLGQLPYAKMVRTADMVIPLTFNGSVSIVQNLVGGGTQTVYRTLLSLPTDSTQYQYAYTSAPDFADIDEFPVYGPPPETGTIVIPAGGTPPIGGAAYYYANQVPIYFVKIGNGGQWQKSTNTGATWSDYTTAGAIALTALAGKYIIAIDGTGNGTGRLIASATFDPSGALGNAAYPAGAAAGNDAGVIAVTLDSTNFFTDDSGNAVQLQANSTVTPQTNDTWVQLCDKYQGYNSDVWPGAGWN